MIYTRPRYRRAFRSLTPQQQDALNTAVARLESLFGRPHHHSAIGLRAFGRYFEFRVGLDLRVLFLADKGDIFLCFVGNHDQARAFIKNQ